MKIKAAIKLDVGDLINRSEPEHINVTCDGDGQLQAMSWLYDTSDGGLYQMAKRRGGVWNRNAGGWTFADTTIAQGLLDAIVKKHPDWPIIGHPNIPFLPLSGIKCSRLELENGLAACLVPFPLPYFTSINSAIHLHIFRVSSAVRKNECVGLLIGSAADITSIINSMRARGATFDNTLKRKWPFTTGGGRLQVKVTGWAVQIKCDLTKPLHYLVAPEQKYHWDGVYPYGTRVATPWEGTIHTTRKLWPALKSKLQADGLEWEGDDPDVELTVSATFDSTRVAGWSSPAPNGYLLHAYQKNGAEFCASRGMRALIGDEMGVGKTVQAIAAAEATSAARILVVCPANARYVWEREIQGWGGRGAIQHITSQLDRIDMSARWHIVTYDLLAARAETWRLNDEQEYIAFNSAFPELARNHKKPINYPLKISLETALNKTPAFSNPKRVATWEKIMQRLRGELLEQFLSAGKILTIMDEAHRAKNKTAKRTKAIQRIAANETQLLMLTGTPLRNNEHEAAALLGLLDAEASIALTKERGYTIQDVKDYLSYFMIRRTKEEVLPELPEKTRQRVDISDLDHEQMQTYRSALDSARDSYTRAILEGLSEKEARQKMQGGIEQARTALGIAKVRGGEVVDLVVEIVENKECCVVFCAHQQASDDLKTQLVNEKLRVAVVDGRTSQKTRTEVVTDFQEGRLDVFIGGINACGEAITLTRADTVIFVELDWVPAALLQAEDRIHRVGQRSNCQVIQLIARISNGANLDEMMIDLIGSKLARIGDVLGEDGSNIISGSIQANVHNRLLSAEAKPMLQEKSIDTQPKEVASEVDVLMTDSKIDESEVELDRAVIADAVDRPKRKRGRPKVYEDNAPPTATERSKQSIRVLAASGGKRVMLRLRPEAHEALKVIMALTSSTQETATINQVLIARKEELLRAYTKNNQPQNADTHLTA